MDDVTPDETLNNEQEEQNTTGDNGGDIVALTEGVTICDYAPFSEGSTFTYKGDAGEYTINVLSAETINGTDYAVLENSLDGSVKYYNCENGIYTELSYVPNPNTTSGPDVAEYYIYLQEDMAGESWENDLTNEDQHIVTYLEMEPYRGVNNVTYEDVIGVQVKVIYGPHSQPTSFDNTFYYWYAKDVGLIETTNGNIQLQSFTIN
ncbi:MAG: hypothetical protein KDC44_01360 [Phaeodactylibacter sp.]|nr:hypothetical protein [Phaeodactylibacter sp.]